MDLIDHGVFICSRLNLHFIRMLHSKYDLMSITAFFRILFRVHEMCQSCLT